MLVGKGEKVLVSVARVAVNRRIRFPLLVIPTGAERSEAQWRDLFCRCVDQNRSLDDAALRAASLGMTGCYGTIPAGSSIQCRAMAPGVVSQICSRCLAM